MIDIINNFYKNKYTNIDNIVKDVIYFLNKLFNWPGLQIPKFDYK